MKNKYHILNESPKISDKELEGFMDFDALLEKNASTSGNSKSDSSKYWLPGILVALLIGTAFWIWSGERISEQEKVETLAQKISNETIESQTPQEITPTIIAATSGDIEQKAAETQASKESPKSEIVANVNSTRKIAKTNVEPQETKKPKAKISESKPVETKKRDAKLSETSSSPVSQTRVTIEKEAHNFVDAQPQGGTKALYKFISKTLKYPSEVEDKTRQGRVLVGFTIAKDGRPINIKVEQSMGELFDQEAIRVIQSMPDWKPATLNGAPMKSKLSIPLLFNPKSEE